MLFREALFGSGGIPTVVVSNWLKKSEPVFENDMVIDTGACVARLVTLVAVNTKYSGPFCANAFAVNNAESNVRMRRVFMGLIDLS